MIQNANDTILTHRIIVALDKKLEPGQAMNTLAQISITLVSASMEKIKHSVS